MTNILSLDFESWVHFYRDAVQQKDFADGKGLAHSDNGYVEMAGEGVIDLLAQHGQKATFLSSPSYTTTCIVKQFSELLQRHSFTSLERFYFAHGS